jgi:hypothetical protein
MRGLASWQSIQAGITAVEWEGDPWPVGKGIEITPCTIIDNGQGGWSGDWLQTAYKIIGNANGVPILDPDYNPDPMPGGEVIGVCDLGVNPDNPTPIPAGRLTITGTHTIPGNGVPGANKIVILTTGGKIECAWVDALGNMMYEGSFLNVSMAKIALASDAGGGGGDQPTNDTIQDLTAAIGKLIADTLTPGTVANPYQVKTSVPLTLYADTDMDDIEFTPGPQWSTYLSEQNAQAWFTVKDKPASATPLIDAQATITDPVSGVVKLSLTQTQLNVKEGNNYFWQMQVRRPIYAGDPPVLQSTKKRMMMEGIAYIKPSFKV